MARNEFAPQINDVNRISVGTEIRGTLSSASDVRIDGIFEGKLTIAGKLVIGENAKLIGEVICKSCDVWGYLEGDIVVKELLGLKKVGCIKGNLSCQKLIIEEGARFDGSCNMISDADFEKKRASMEAEFKAETTAGLESGK